MGAIIAGMIIIAGIVATGSRGGLFAATAGIMYYSLSYKKHDRRARQRIVLFFIILVLAVVFLLYTNYFGNSNIVSRLTGSNLTDASNRTEIWGKYLTLLINRPWGWLIGYGYDQGAVEYRNFGGYISATHSDLLYILVGTGLIGVILTYHLVRDVWRKSAKMEDHLGRACIILMLVAGLSVNIFDRYGWWNAMIFAYIGIGAIEASGNETT